MAPFKDQEHQLLNWEMLNNKTIKNMSEELTIFLCSK